MKPMMIFSLILLGASLASGAVHAKGGHGGMGSGAFSRHDTPQRTETRAQSRTENRVQARDGSQAGDAQRNLNREQVRTETHEQARSEGLSAPGQ